MSAAARWMRTGLSIAVLVVVIAVVPSVAAEVARLRFGSPYPWSGVPAPADWDRERIDDSLLGPWRTDLVTDLVVRAGLVIAWVAVSITVVNIALEFRQVIGRPTGTGRARPAIGTGWSRRVARFVVVGIALVAVPTGQPALGSTDPTTAGSVSVDHHVLPNDVDSIAGHDAGDRAGRSDGPHVRDDHVRPVPRWRIHVVEPGESVMSIAASYARPDAVEGLALAIVEANRADAATGGPAITHAAMIEPGWTLRIPVTAGHRVSDVDGMPGDGVADDGQSGNRRPRHWSEIWQVTTDDRVSATALPPPDTPPDDMGDGSSPVPDVDVPVAPEPPPIVADPRPSPTTTISRPPTATISRPASPTSTVPTSTAPGKTVPSTPDSTPNITSGTAVTAPTTKATPSLTPAPTDSGSGSLDRPPSDRGADDTGEADRGEVDPGTSAASLAAAVSTTDPSADRPGSTDALIGGGVMLAAGALIVLGARRRRLWRRGAVPVRAPAPHQEVERRLRSLAGDDRIIRLDLLLRSLAAAIAHRDLAVVVVFLDREGAAEAILTGEIEAVAPWEPGPTTRSWSLDADVGRDSLVAAAGITPLPAIAVVQIGVDDRDREVYVDLETIGVFGVDAAETGSADTVLRAIAATLAVSPFAESASLVGIGLDPENFVGHPHARVLEDRRQSAVLRRTGGPSSDPAGLAPAFARRARAHGGERWQPTIVLVAGGQDLSGSERTSPLGEAMVVVGRAVDAGLVLEQTTGSSVGWTLRGRLLDRPPVDLVPIGLDRGAVTSLHTALEVIGDERPPGPVFLVRLFGAVEVVDAGGRPVSFDKSRSRELLVWMVTHRHRSTRSAARTALWEVDVKNSSFTNVVSDARCSLARHHPPPGSDEWIGRSLTEDLVLADGIESDAEIIERALSAARRSTPLAAITHLRPAVALIRGMPFESSGYLWPDGEGITSSLVVLGTTAATELAEHALGLGDLETVIWSTDHGLRILSAHEGLIGLRLRAHAMVGDQRALRQEWLSYLAALAADPWSDGVPAPKLLGLFDELTSGAGSRR